MPRKVGMSGSVGAVGESLITRSSLAAFPTARRVRMVGRGSPLGAIPQGAPAQPTIMSWIR